MQTMNQTQTVTECVVSATPHLSVFICLGEKEESVFNCEPGQRFR